MEELKNNITNEQIKNLWYKNFPNSEIFISKQLLGNGLYFRCILAKNRQECSNGYLDNDNLHYVFTIEEKNYIEYHNPFIFIKPENKYLAYSRVKLRKKNIKNITLEKLEKRILQVKQLIIDNKENFINLQFNINDKI